MVPYEQLAIEFLHCLGVIGRMSRLQPDAYTEALPHPDSEERCRLPGDGTPGGNVDHAFA